jgi:flavin-dependent dehydrogenase
VLLVGDAAGIDALTGEGIAVAMEQAMVAADVVAGGLSRGDLRFTRYAAALRRATVGRELRLDGWIARLVYGSNWARWCGAALADPMLLARYAERIAGTTVLADRKCEIVWSLARSLLPGPRLTRWFATPMRD